MMMAVFFIIVWFIMIFINYPSGDVVVFYGYSQEYKAGSLFEGGAFSEYPPLAWIFILVPGMLTSDLQTYYAIYATIDIICMYVTGLALIRICEGCTLNLRGMILAYLVITAIYADLAVWKFDIIPVAMMALSMMFFLEKKYMWAVVFSVIGGFIKLFPFIVLPIFMAMALHHRIVLIQLIKAVIYCLIAVTIAMLILLALRIDMGTIVGFIFFQNDRGFHIESLIGTVSVVICHIMGWETSYIERYHTHDVDNQICYALIGDWNYVFLGSLAIAFAIVIIGAWKNKVSLDGEECFKFLITASLLMMSVLLLFNKVFSTQFIQWLYPLVVLHLCYRDKVGFISLFGIVIGIMAISKIFLMTHSQELLLVRDVFLFVLLWYSVRYVLFAKWNTVLSRINFKM